MSGGWNWFSILCHFDYRCKAFKWGLESNGQPDWTPSNGGIEGTHLTVQNHFCKSDTTYDEPDFITCSLNEGWLFSLITS